MAYKVKLTEKQRQDLIEIVHNGKHQAKIIMHSNILLQADCSVDGPGLRAVAIAENLNVSQKTVHRVRQRYSEEGFEAALYRKPHKKHKPRKLDGDGEAHLIALCCSQAPSGRKSWTLQLLADELIRLNVVDQISSVTIYNTLKKINLSHG